MRSTSESGGQIRRENSTLLRMAKSVGVWFLLVFHARLVEPLKPFEFDIGGSGDVQRTHQECYPEFQLFDQKYLRGVNKPFYKTKSNNVTLQGCMELCCNLPPEICKSFSYFLDLNVCYLMNVTQFDKFALLQHAVSFKHYHRSLLCSNHWCQNGGTCVMRVDVRSTESYPQCNCPDGFEGRSCERVVKKGSLPTYVVIVAILGSLFLLLFGAVLVLYLVYRRRTGKYRVRRRRDQWKKTLPASP